MFESLPIELRELVFQYACSDGGRAGCTLALVSRAVAAQARPWRYRSVVLIGARAILAFAALASQKTRAGEALPVHCLFIADHAGLAHHVRSTVDGEGLEPALRDHSSLAAQWDVDEAWYHSVYNEPYRTPPTPLQRLLLGVGSPPHRVYGEHALAQAHVRGVTLALLDIFGACARALRALHLELVAEPVFLPYFVPVPMPALRDLTVAILPLAHLRASVLTTADALHFARVFPPAPEAPCAPALRRLHVLDGLHISVFGHRRTREHVECLRTLAPAADCLRLTMATPPALAERPPDGFEQLEARSEGLFADEEHELFDYYVLWRRVADAADADTSAPPQMIALPSSEDILNNSYDKPADIVPQWLDRVAWRQCWTEYETIIPLAFWIS